MGLPVSITICTASALNCGLNRRRCSAMDRSSQSRGPVQDPWYTPADLEPGDALGRPARGLGDEDACLVVEADGPVGGFDVEGASGMGDADVDALSGDYQGAAAGHPSLDPDRLGRGGRGWARRAGGAGPGDLRCRGRGRGLILLASSDRGCGRVSTATGWPES